MRVGVLDILAIPSQDWSNTIYNTILTKQYASVTPQAISVWCRQLGHETFYATYYGVGDLDKLLPPDLDVVFIACYTQVSPIAYALAKIYRQAGTLTVIGGPHAKAFPVDCLRFFDLVVKECDKELIADILGGHFDPGSFISSAKPFNDLPTVEERMPEIRASAFFGGKWSLSPIIPMLASMGCPYKCDFCTDWDNPYRILSTERLENDLRYLAQNYPRAMMAFHDPNFAIKFDQVFDVLEAIEPDLRLPYIMECSLSILRGSRMKRLKETNCIVIAPGVESWTNYSNKAGVGRKAGEEKVQRMVEHFHLLHEYVPYQQANFMFGLDTDMGDEPIRLTKSFIDQTEFIWPAINIPVPFGGTPLYDEQLANGRILKAMPFTFYYAPYLVITLKNYDPVTYYEKLIELISFSSTKVMQKRRIKSVSNWKLKVIHWTRTTSARTSLKNYQRILDMLRQDAHFRAFHEGQSDVLPQFYEKEADRILGRYAELLSPAERTPNLEQMKPLVSGQTNILKMSNLVLTESMAVRGA